MPEGKLAGIVAGTWRQTTTPEGANRDATGLVDDPSVVVTEVDIDDVFLGHRATAGDGVPGGPEVDVTGACAGLENRIAFGRRRTGKVVDIDDALRVAQRLRSVDRGFSATFLEGLDAIVGAIADINQAVVAQHHAVRVAATGMSEGTARARIGAIGALVVHAVLAPLAHVVVSHASVAGAKDDNAVIAVAVRDVDVTPGTRDRSDVRIDAHIRGFVKQGVTSVETVGFAAGGINDGARWISVADALLPDLD